MEDLSSLMQSESSSLKKRLPVLQAVVFWLKDKKISKLPVTHIKMESERKEGQTTQVRCGKLGKFYSAKILKISDDEGELDRFFQECLEKMDDLAAAAEELKSPGPNKSACPTSKSARPTSKSAGPNSKLSDKCAGPTCTNKPAPPANKPAQNESPPGCKEAEKQRVDGNEGKDYQKKRTLNDAKTEKKRISVAKTAAQRALATEALKQLAEQKSSTATCDATQSTDRSSAKNVDSTNDSAGDCTTDSCHLDPANAYSSLPVSDEHGSVSGSPISCISSAVNTIIWPESSQSGTYNSPFRPVAMYAGQQKSYTYLKSSAERINELEEFNSQLLHQLATERANHAREMESIQATHARQFEKLKMDHAMELEGIKEHAQQSFSALDGYQVTPGKVKFLKDLASTFQKKNEEHDAAPTCKKRLRLTSSAECHSYDLITQQVPDIPDILQNSPPAEHCASTSARKEPSSSLDGQSCSWVGTRQQHEENLQSPSSVIPLVDDFPDVTLTKEQRSRCILKGDGKPELLVRELLSVFFTTEELAGGNALGARTAHNRATGAKYNALNYRIINAIKRFVLLKFRQPSGQPILKDKEFNAVINSKCASARRSLASLHKTKK